MKLERTRLAGHLKLPRGKDISDHFRVLSESTQESPVPQQTPQTPLRRARDMPAPPCDFVLVLPLPGMSFSISFVSLVYEMVY